MELLSPQMAALVPAILGVVAVFTGIGLPKKYAQLLALALGIAGAFSFAPAGAPIATIVVSGLLLGLASSGLYQGGKKIISN